MPSTLNEFSPYDILCGIGCAVAVVSAQDQKVLYANPEFEFLTSYESADLVQKNLTTLFSEKDRRRAHELMSLSLESGDDVTDNNFLLQRKSGRKILVSLRVHRLNEHKALVTLVNKTISEEQAWQLADSQSAFFQSAKFAALGEMAGGIAHEINNPLAIIHSCAELMQSMVSEGLVNKPSASDMISKILNNTKRVADIVKGLRAITRDERAIPKQTGPLLIMTEHAVNLCRERFRKAGIEFSVKLPPPEWLVTAHPSQISQALLCLLNNASEAVNNVPSGWIHLTAVNKEKFYELHISDNGPGVPKELRQRIMEPFFTTKPVGGGPGLGLSFAKGIMEYHEGSLRLDPSSEHTRFVLSLPKAG